MFIYCRKRYSGNTLNVPQETKALYSLSSHEGGDEYSSEASEMDTHGPVSILSHLNTVNLDINACTDYF